VKPVSVHPVSDLSKEQRKSVSNITAYLTKFFAEQGKKIAAQVSKAYESATKKADDPEAKAKLIVDSTDMEAWDIISEELADDLGGAYEQTAQVILGKLGITDQDVFDLVNEDSVKYAAESGAELVTGITETTRERLQVLVRDAIQNADGVNELKSAIEDSEAFSADRAEMIARTEIGNAHMAGALEGAKASGLDLVKSVVRGSEDNDCDICGDNEDDGEIGLDEDFSSGDDAPLFHPNCACTLVFSVSKDSSD
jgi:hypothetical protein